jgi:ribulose-5-phosphate 4-epimerase/fuculose-1-phosphate aldolase
MSEVRLREKMCELGKALYDRGYSVGGGGNLSLKLPEGGFLVTPTGSCLGRLDPATLSTIDAAGKPVAGAKPSKEFVFHHAVYGARPDAGAIVHLHSTYLTALSCLETLDTANAIRPFTPYFVMRIGTLPVIPYYRPGSPKIAEALAALAPTVDTQAFLLANHGPVVLGSDIDDAVGNAEELEETAKLVFLLRGEKLRYLTDAEIQDLRS